jgi:hypothetical protein
MYRLLTLIFFSISVVACTLKLNRVDPAYTEATLVATEPVCQPSLIQKSENSFPEIQGTMKSDGEMCALLFFDEAHANEELKIVWKITGTGFAFAAQAQHEDGTIVLPIWGPEVHTDSNWRRPGEEWGTGFNFPKPGCWTITVTSGETRGEIILDVLPELAANIQGERRNLFSSSIGATVFSIQI